VTPAPPINLQNPTAPPQVMIELGQFGQQTLGNNNPQLYDFTIGTGASGTPMALATFTEPGLMDICHQRSTVCSPNSSDPRFRNAWIDLRPGGAVIYIDVTLSQLGGVPLTAGIVLRWDAILRRVVVAGVDLNGTLYTTAPEGLGATVADLEAKANTLIQQLAVEAGGGRYALADVRIDDTSLTLVLR